MEQRIKKHVQPVARGQGKTPGEGRPAYLIRISGDRDQARALVAFRHVREAVHCLKEDEFFVTNEHLEALEKAGVPFEDITEAPGNHGQEEAG